MIDQKIFSYLQPYPEVHSSMLSVVSRVNAQDWMVASQMMRTVLEKMVSHIYSIYSRETSLDLFEKICALENAGLISDETAKNYHAIRKSGNSASHGSADEASCSVTVPGLFQLLVEESVLFAEKYARIIDPNGMKNLRRKDRRNHQNTYFSPWTVRLAGFIYILAGSVFICFTYAFGFVDFQKGVPSVFTPFCVLFMVIGGISVIGGLYSLITGNERILLELRKLNSLNNTGGLL